MGFCGYCGSNSPNSTDTCCENSNAASRCENISVPTTTATLPPIFPSSTSSSTAAASSSGHSLSGGQIAGAVVGSVAGFAILVALALAALLCLRRRRRAESDTALNQPNPQRKGTPSMRSKSQASFNYVPGGRVTRMAALREMPSLASRRSRRFFGGSNKFSDVSDSEGTSASPGAVSKQIPPVTGKRHGSLTSSSVLAGASNDTSPRSAKDQHSSPEGVSSGQSERLSSFQDYYSQDYVHPGDRVAVLWSYQARASDEFALDRGELLKVIGIWDDGWATGIRLPETAESYDFRHHAQRDSGVSNGSHQVASPSPVGEIKAFPMVCVCLPQHWRKIIDGGCPGEEDSP